MKRYVRLGEEDATTLLAFRSVASPHFGRIAREFYERIREHEEAHAVFTGEVQIERLQRSLVSWMDRLLSGSYDAHPRLDGGRRRSRARDRGREDKGR